MYEFLSPIAGFSYQRFEHKAFPKALLRAKVEIDIGYPRVLGALDMCCLPCCEKLYQTESIPFRYCLMTGYDDERQCFYLNDCGRAEMQTLRHTQLSLAWDCLYPGLSKLYALYTVRMNSGKSKCEIAKEALRKRRELFLNLPVGLIGYHGFCKFITELSG